jgi:CubicO group peptidase (beta-lactamase class C family)
MTIDAYLRTELEQQQIPGMSVAVSRNGEIVFAQGYGLANVERTIPATPHTIYRVASLTKSFTAAGIMMLVEEGKIALDESLTRHFSDAPAAWDAITLRHLLNHTSGLEDWENVSPGATVSDALRAETPDEILRFLAQFPLRFAPGERWDYSNSGYLLLGRITERVSGEPLENFRDRRIFRPLQMTCTAKNFLDLDLLTTGYVRAEGILKRVDPTPAWGHGGLVSTVIDLAKWDAALNTDRLLSPASRERMWTPAKLNDGTEVGYGLGWDIGSFQGRKTIGHGGGRIGVSARLLHVPEESTTVILLAAIAGLDTGAMARRILECYLAAPDPGSV